MIGCGVWRSKLLNCIEAKRRHCGQIGQKNCIGRIFLADLKKLLGKIWFTLGEFFQSFFTIGRIFQWFGQFFSNYLVTLNVGSGKKKKFRRKIKRITRNHAKIIPPASSNLFISYQFFFLQKNNKSCFVLIIALSKNYFLEVLKDWLMQVFKNIVNFSLTLSVRMLS